MKMFKKLVAAVLMSCIVLSLSAPAFAAEDTKTPGMEPCDVVLNYDPTQAGGLVNGELRGKSVPTKFWNLDERDYNVSGVYDTTIYTEYYFLPSGNGDIYYNFTFEWTEPRGVQVAATVEWWDKTTGKMVLSESFALPDNGDGTYGPKVSTGSWHAYNLDPTHQYYVRFTKAFDGIDVNITGTISTGGYV